MDSGRKRGRQDPAFSGNGGFKRAKEEMDSYTGVGSKSKPCTKFFSMSGCAFGVSCHFLHYIPGYNAHTQLANIVISWKQELMMIFLHHIKVECHEVAAFPVMEGQLPLVQCSTPGCTRRLAWKLKFISSSKKPILRAFNWEKEGLVTELRRELSLSNEEHMDLLNRVNAYETIRRIREWRQSCGFQPAT